MRVNSYPRQSALFFRRAVLLCKTIATRAAVFGESTGALSALDIHAPDCCSLRMGTRCYCDYIDILQSYKGDWRLIWIFPL